MTRNFALKMMNFADRWQPSDRGDAIFDPSFDLSTAATQQHIADTCEQLRTATCDAEACMDGTNLLARPGGVDCFIDDWRTWYVGEQCGVCADDPEDQLVSKNDKFCIKNKEFCIKNKESCMKNKEFSIKHDEFSIKYDEFSIKHDEFSIKHDEFSIKHDEFCSRARATWSSRVG